jgi:polyhydroxyalkanoate synthesis regulator phasin
MSKQVTIYVSRKITLNRADKDPIALEQGRNVVDADVADHPFVKHHTIEGGSTVDGAELEELRARVEELTEQLAAGNAPGTGGKAIEKVRADLAAARAELATAGKAMIELRNALDAERARVAELEQQLAAKDADMAALVDAMSKPADAARA